MKLHQLDECFKWLKLNLSTTDSKDRVRHFNGVLGLSLGNNPTYKNLYEHAKDLFEVYGDDNKLSMTLKVFKELMNGLHRPDIYSDDNTRPF